MKNFSDETFQVFVIDDCKLISTANKTHVEFRGRALKARVYICLYIYACIHCILRFPVYYTIVGLHVIVFVTFAAVCLRLQ